MYREISNDIQIDVEPTYLPEHSNPKEGLHVFSYRIKITNLSGRPTQLMSRHWVITDGHGNTREVKGPGVVGEQPLLNRGESFEYSSFCPLPTPTGNMRGTYVMADERGQE